MQKVADLAHRHGHRQDAEGRPAHHAERHRRRLSATAQGCPFTGRLIAASEQIKAATGVDLAAARRPRPPQG
jgi:hypothetical protein